MWVESLEVMSEWRDGILRRRRPVRIGDRTHRWIAHGSGVERQESAIRQLVIVQRGKLHEEIVWVLAVHDGTPEGGLALLEEFRIAPVRNRGRLETEHGPDGQRAAAEFSLCHRHPPVGGEKFVGATRPGLLHVAQEGFPMKHEGPIALGGHEHGGRSGVRLSIRARRGVLQQEFDERMRGHARRAVIHPGHAWHGLICSRHVHFHVVIAVLRGS